MTSLTVRGEGGLESSGGAYDGLAATTCWWRESHGVSSMQCSFMLASAVEDCILAQMWRAKHFGRVSWHTWGVREAAQKRLNAVEGKWRQIHLCSCLKACVEILSASFPLKRQTEQTGSIFFGAPRAIMSGGLTTALGVICL